MARVECPECGVLVMVRDDLPAGRRVRCPKCEAVFRPFEEERDRTEEGERGRPAAAAARARVPHDEDGGDDQGGRADEEERADEDEAVERPRRRPAKKGKSAVYWILLALSVLAAAGSITFFVITFMQSGGNKLDQDITFELEPNKIDIRTFAPVSKDETLKVSVTATGGKVRRVSVYAQKGNVAATSVEAEKLRDPVARQLNVSEATLEAAIPADHTAIVVMDASFKPPCK